MVASMVFWIRCVEKEKGKKMKRFEKGPTWLVALLLLFVWCLKGYFDTRRHVPLLIGAAYWHFVDVVWLAVFFTFYLLPRLW